MKARTLARAMMSALILCLAPALRAAAPTKSKPVLSKDMPAAVIIQLIGQPDEIQPMPAEGVKAEKWTYRRKVDQNVFQTANTQAFQPAMVGVDGGGVVIGRTVVPEYRLKYAELSQVTVLLVIDGKLHLARQWFERKESFAD